MMSTRFPRLGRLLAGPVLAAWMTACGGGGGGGGSAQPVAVSYPLSGVAQKGPLAVGSQIQVSELDAGLNPNGKLYTVQTSDAMGSFSIPGGLASPLVDITADGFYLDEVSGHLSASRVQLRAVADLSVSATPAVNILTTLQQARLKALVTAGSSVAAASTQSQNEVLQALGVTPSRVDGLGSLVGMRLNGSTDADAVLLAASVLFAQMATDAAAASGANAAAELSNLVNTFAAQIATSGAITSSSFALARSTAAARVDLAAARQNLETYYAQNGAPLSAAKFEEWIDRSNSGVLPQRLIAVPTLVLPAVQSSAPGQLTTSNAVTVSGLGGGTYVAVSVSAGVAIVRNGVALVGTQAVAKDGDTLAFTVASPGYGSSSTATVSVGASSVGWVVSSPAFGGNVSGLAGSGLVLQNNGADSIAVTPGASRFTLPASPSGSAFSLTVLRQPTAPLQFCTLANATGTVGATTSDPAVSCVKVTDLLLLVQASPTQTLASYITHPSNGTMLPAANGPVPTGTTASPISVKVDRDGRFAFVLNNSGGTAGNSISVFAINRATGGLTPAPGSPYALANRPGSLTLHPNGRFVYAACDCAAALEIFAVDAGTGALSAATGAPTDLASALGFTFAPAGGFAFIPGSGQLRVYTVSDTTGALTAAPGSPYAVPAAVGAQIGVDPTGRFLYAASDFPSNGLWGFSVEPSTGAPTLMPGSPLSTGTARPANIVFDPLGRFVYLGILDGGGLGYAIDPASGALTSLPTYPPLGFGGTYPVAITPAGTMVFHATSRFPPPVLYAYAVDSTGTSTFLSSIAFSRTASIGFTEVALVSIP